MRGVTNFPCPAYRSCQKTFRIGFQTVQNDSRVLISERFNRDHIRHKHFSLNVDTDKERSYEKEVKNLPNP